MRIIESNVKGTRIEKDNNNNFWSVGGKKYLYSYANSMAIDGGYFDILHAPIGTEVIGDIVEIRRTITNGNNPLEHYTEIAFHAHEKQFERKIVEKWSKDHWVRNFGTDIKTEI